MARSGDRCVIGSVKSNIGHLLTAAGAAALTKVLLAMQEETLPPTANFTARRRGWIWTTARSAFCKPAVPGNGGGRHVPRRAAVSAFGFGGINAHLLIEEWLPEATAQSLSHGLQLRRQTATSGTRRSSAQDRPMVAVVGMDARFGPWQVAALLSGAGSGRGLRDATHSRRRNGGEPRRAPGSGTKAWTGIRFAGYSTWTMWRSLPTNSASRRAKWRKCCPSSCSCSRPQQGPWPMPASAGRTTCIPESSSASPSTLTAPTSASAGLWPNRPPPGQRARARTSLTRNWRHGPLDCEMPPALP